MLAGVLTREKQPKHMDAIGCSNIDTVRQGDAFSAYRAHGIYPVKTTCTVAATQRNTAVTVGRSSLTMKRDHARSTVQTRQQLAAKGEKKRLLLHFQHIGCG